MAMNVPRAPGFAQMMKDGAKVSIVLLPICLLLYMKYVDNTNMLILGAECAYCG